MPCLIQSWLYMLTVRAHQVYKSPLLGGNAYLYLRESGILCYAFLYAKPGKDWEECAAKHMFTNGEIPINIQKQMHASATSHLDISELLLQAVQTYYNKIGDEIMKFNLFVLCF